MNIEAIVNQSAPLTKRERQVYGLLAEGRTRQQIAFYLCRSLRTVDAHIDHILNKLDADNAHHAVSVGVANGFLHIIRRIVCLALVVGLTHSDIQVVRVRARTREIDITCGIRQI